MPGAGLVQELDSGLVCWQKIGPGLGFGLRKVPADDDLFQLCMFRCLYTMWTKQY